MKLTGIGLVVDRDGWSISMVTHGAWPTMTVAVVRSVSRDDRGRGRGLVEWGISKLRLQDVRMRSREVGSDESHEVASES